VSYDSLDVFYMAWRVGFARLEPRIHNVKSFFTPIKSERRSSSHSSNLDNSWMLRPEVHLPVGTLERLLPVWSSQSMLKADSTHNSYRSVRPTFDKIIVNVDVTVGVVWALLIITFSVRLPTSLPQCTCTRSHSLLSRVSVPQRCPWLVILEATPISKPSVVSEKP
jgi:hypothetical protein